ncbi:S8 family peptidase, partial [bacterium]|nr:S8 family peptidase [bacterium]
GCEPTLPGDMRQLMSLKGGESAGAASLNGEVKSSGENSLLTGNVVAPKKSPGKPPADIANALVGIDKVWDQGFTGQGQTIAVIDSGIYPHPDLKDKIVGWVDIRDGMMSPCDDYGHGTHVAGIAAGTGVSSAGKHKGVAPDANVVGVRIASVSDAIKGIQWVIEHKDELHIGVINMSLGDFAARSYKDDPWAQAAEKAMEAGLVVCVAAGNDGPSEFNISTPGIHPDVITVGALDDKGTMRRDDDTVASFSSRGPTSVDHLRKPDILAPGVNVYGPLAPGSVLDDPDAPHDGPNYFAISGTSMATPMVAGLAAVLLSANPKLTHQEIKEIIVRSADNYLPDEPNIQGAGVLNAERALELALNWDSTAEADKVARSVENNRVPVGKRIVRTGKDADISKISTGVRRDNHPAQDSEAVSGASDSITASLFPVVKPDAMILSDSHDGFLMA